VSKITGKGMRKKIKLGCRDQEDPERPKHEEII